MTEFETIIRQVTAEYRRNKGLPPLAGDVTVPASIRRQDMARLDHSYIELSITACGITREVEAKVTFIHSPAMRGYRDSEGAQIDPDEPERAEIQTVRVRVVTEDDIGEYVDISHFLTAEQLEAIETEILEQGA